MCLMQALHVYEQSTSYMWHMRGMHANSIHSAPMYSAHVQYTLALALSWQLPCTSGISRATREHMYA